MFVVHFLFFQILNLIKRGRERRIKRGQREREREREREIITTNRGVQTAVSERVCVAAAARGGGGGCELRGEGARSCIASNAVCAGTFWLQPNGVHHAKEMARLLRSVGLVRLPQQQVAERFIKRPASCGKTKPVSAWSELRQVTGESKKPLRSLFSSSFGGTHSRDVDRHDRGFGSARFCDGNR